MHTSGACSACGGWRLYGAPLWVWGALTLAVICMSAGGTLFALLEGVPAFNKAAWRLWWTAFFQAPLFLHSVWRATLPRHRKPRRAAPPPVPVRAFQRAPARRKSRAQFWHAWWAHMPLMLLTGAVLAVHFAAWAWSVDHTTLARSLLFVSAHPLVGILAVGAALAAAAAARGCVHSGALCPPAVVALAAWTPRRLGALELGGTALALGGAAVMVLPGAQGGGSGGSLAGDAAALLGAVAMAVYLWVGAAMRRWMPLWLYAFPVTAAGALAASVGALAQPGVAPGAPGPGGWFGWADSPEHTALAAAAGLVSGICGHSLAILALAHLSPLVVSVSLLLEPLFGSLIGWLAGAQGAPSPWTAVGGVLLLAGVTAITVGTDSARPAPQAPAPAQHLPACSVVRGALAARPARRVHRKACI